MFQDPDISPLSLALSPSGHLYLYSDSDNQESVPKITAEHIQSFFSVNDSIGLLHLGLTNFSTPLPPSLSFWQHFSHIFIALVCKQTGFNTPLSPSKLIVPLDEINPLLNEAPFMKGVEHLNTFIIQKLWQGLIKALTNELKAFEGDVDAFLNAHHSAWNTVGRVCFHLAENKKNPELPFAFLATYTTGLSKTTQAQHLPLSRALEEYSETSQRSQLLTLLLPVQRAAETSAFIKNLVDAGKIFKPLAWSPKEAFQFLQDIPLLEAAGIIVRVPNWWNPKKPTRPNINITVGNKSANIMGLDALLDFDIKLALPTGEQLTPQEFERLVSNQDQLVQIKGQWVQVDGQKLSQVLSYWKKIERRVKKEGLSFAEGLRILAGVSNNQIEGISSEEVSTWSTVIEGDYLKDTLKHLRDPEVKGEKALQTVIKKHLKTELRTYQERGVQWLWWLYTLRLGGCLADDMGLGKTVQVLSLLLLVKHHATVVSSRESRPHLLILPASLLDNWQNEINHFAPSLRTWRAHSSSGGKMQDRNAPKLAHYDIVMTTYGTMHRLPWLSDIDWDIVVLDEAQAIKNPNTKQARAIKQLNCRVRFALTGTPIENRLLDLWSLFDFLAPGLLGSHRAFAKYSKQIPKSKTETQAEADHKEHFFAAVRRLIRPYLLRRLKSDKNIIQDLPDKTEVQTYCTLTKQQVALYQQAVNELTKKLERPVEGIQRQGLVLSYLLRLKQICNHPDQWLGQGEYDTELSGKFARLQELCATIAEKQEKVLVFTQFTEIIPALHRFLSTVFGQEGVFLHGQTPVKDRTKRIQAFQEEQEAPYFILSLKTGGIGLNLTAASHVIHFDRWWNPAAENQATDRAYRIGQKKNVLVHKFICRGTIEEKIDALIESKKSLSEEMIGQAEATLTELSDAELIKIVSLDIHRALGDDEI